jgi:hypothetical protein
MLGLLLLAMGGCGDDEASRADAAASIDAALVDAALVDAAPIDASATLVMFGGTVHSYDALVPLSAQPPLGGVEVCLVSMDPPVCVMTDALGTWAISVPANDDGVRFTFSVAGHLGIYYVTFTTDVDDTDHYLILIPDAVVSSSYGDCAAMYPETSAGILLQGFRRTGPTSYTYLEGATLAATAGVGPCDFSGVYEHDPAQSATREAGLGVTLFANVPAPGTVDVTITLSGTTCYSYANLVDTATPNVIQVPLLAGYQTLLDIVCEWPPATAHSQKP